MSAIEVIAKPVFGKIEADWLSKLRENRAHSPGSPEFTLVFPGSESTANEIVQHVRAVCTTTTRIRFCLRSAVIVPDMGQYHVFLVPDEGFGAIVRLHDRLHVGPLKNSLRPEEPYIPHLTIASLSEFNLARRIKASLNAQDLAIAGHIDELEVQQRDGATPRCIAKITLVRHGLFH